MTQNYGVVLAKNINPEIATLSHSELKIEREREKKSSFCTYWSLFVLSVIFPFIY